MTTTVRNLALPILALVALVGVFVTYIVHGSVPTEEWTLATVLVGAVAGVSVPTAAAVTKAAPVVAMPELEPAPYPASSVQG